MNGLEYFAFDIGTKAETDADGDVWLPYGRCSNDVGDGLLKRLAVRVEEGRVCLRQKDADRLRKYEIINSSGMEENRLAL